MGRCFSCCQITCMCNTCVEQVEFLVACLCNGCWVRRLMLGAYVLDQRQHVAPAVEIALDRANMLEAQRPCMGLPPTIEKRYSICRQRHSSETIIFQAKQIQEQIAKAGRLEDRSYIVILQHRNIEKTALDERVRFPLGVERGRRNDF